LDPAAEVDEDALSADFAKELAKGMESLMQELGGIDKGQSDETEPSEEEKEAAQKAFAAAWEAMLTEGMDGMTEPIGQPLGPEGVKGTTETETDFAKKIRETMEHLKQSESNLQVRRICHSFCRIWSKCLSRVAKEPAHQHPVQNLSPLWRP
jgi:peroxin-19